MSHVVVFIVGVLIGGAGAAICIYFAIESRRKAMSDQQRHLADRAEKLKETADAIELRRGQVEERMAELKKVESELRAVEAGVIKYKDLQAENAILKRDLRNLHIGTSKTELDIQEQERVLESLKERGDDLGRRFLKDNIKWIGSSLTANNYVKMKQRLQSVVEWCRGVGFKISGDEEAGYLADLKTEFEKAVRAAFEREEQARIRAQIREEQKLRHEIDNEIQRLDRERAAIQAALEKALAEAADEHSAEVERLRARLREAEEKSARAASQAQLTKAGHVYVISNIGSLGEGVFKIGMTRRLEPNDRVRELGDASVPFPFDVHMMISSNDAPALENALHRGLHERRLNKINLRKEFFNASIDAIQAIVKEKHGEVEYVADPEALEYRQSLQMSVEDQEFIESVYDELEDEETPLAD